MFVQKEDDRQLAPNLGNLAQIVPTRRERGVLVQDQHPIRPALKSLERLGRIQHRVHPDSRESAAQGLGDGFGEILVLIDQQDPGGVRGRRPRGDGRRNTLRLGVRVEDHPVHADGLHHFQKADEIHRLSQIGRYPEFGHALDVPGVDGVREDDHGEVFQDGVGADPLQDLNPRNFRQLEIQEHEGGQGVPLAIGKLSFAREVPDRHVAIHRDVNRIDQVGLLEGSLEKEDLIGVVFHEK